MTWKAQFDYKPNGFDRRGADVDVVFDGPQLGPVMTTQATASAKRKAARYVASRSDSAAECAELLDMLGLTPDDGLATLPEEH